MKIINNQFPVTTKKEKSFDSWLLNFGASSAGFVLVYAVLVAGVLLTIGVGIYSITAKEVVLSRFGRESQIAFALADIGVECALYWDLRHEGVFATSATPVLPPATTTGLACGGFQINDPPFSYSGNATQATTTFIIELPVGCAQVAIGKYNSGNTTRIDSRGYNTCDLSYQNRVERGLRLSY